MNNVTAGLNYPCGVEVVKGKVSAARKEIPGWIGRKLLKDKQDELMRRFMDMTKCFRKLRREVEGNQRPVCRVVKNHLWSNRNQYHEQDLPITRSWIFTEML